MGVVRERRAKEQRARNIAMERRRKGKAAKAAAEKNAKVMLKKAMRIANMWRARERSAKRIAHERRRKVQRRALKAKETAHKAKIKQMKIAAAKLAKFRRVQKCIAVGMAKARARHAKMANKCMRI